MFFLAGLVWKGRYASAATDRIRLLPTDAWKDNKYNENYFIIFLFSWGSFPWGWHVAVMGCQCPLATELFRT